MKLKLGLLPPSHDPRDLKFSTYRTTVPLPPHPSVFGHADLFPKKGYGMLGNDEEGDCAIAGPMHQEMILNKLAGVDVDFTTQNALQVYGEITGFDPATGEGDNGTDMRDLAKYWMETGMLDSAGNRHKIAGYIWLDPGNPDQLDEAMYLFDAGVGIGFQVPRVAMDQFNAGQPWDVVEDDGGIEGGHYVPGIGNDGNIIVITWAQTQPMTKAFYVKYADQILVIISQEALTNGKSPEGFAYADLQADIQALQQA